ncbi:MAG: polysaccharide deacetylase family protein, partial [Gammaproteobacteria bacterium]
MNHRPQQPLLLRHLGFSCLLLACLAMPAYGASSGVIVLYHHVATDTPPSTTISPADFRRHLEYLRDNDFNVMPLDQLVESLRSGQGIPDKSVAITFDDGYISIYEEAFPMLQSFGFPFTLFLSTGPIDENQRNYMNWSQVKEMADAGVIIANHMVEHPYMLDRSAGESDQDWITRLRRELLAAENTIATQTGQAHRYLAYPYGEFDPAIKDMIAAEGFTGFAQNSGAIGPGSDFLALPRYPLASIYANLDTARTKFSSLAFDAELVSPLSPVTQRRDPRVTLRFNPGDYRIEQIGCFAESEALPMEWLNREEGLVRLVPEKEFQGRRWRYICTAPQPGSNRFYW